VGWTAILRKVHAYVVRLRFSEPLSGVDHLRTVHVALPRLREHPGFVDWFVLGEPGRENEIQITTLWETEEASIETVLTDIASELGAEVIAAGGVAVVAIGVAKSPMNFDNEQGNFHWPPDVTLNPGKPWEVQPPTLKCTNAYYVYAADASWVGNCAAYGPGGANNPECTSALAEATKFANGITCPSECPKQVQEIWRGWSCGAQGNKFLATGAVELEITCGVTN